MTAMLEKCCEDIFQQMRRDITRKRHRELFSNVLKEDPERCRETVKHRNLR
jgi:hypothetical protein